VRNPETVEVEHLIAWREGLLMTFDESPWQGAISPLTLRPMCALGTPGRNPKLIATVSSMPQLVSGINSTLPTVLSSLKSGIPPVSTANEPKPSDVSSGLKLIQAAVRLGTFLDKEFDRQRLKLTSLTVSADSGIRVFESAADGNTLTRPPDSLLDVAKENAIRPADLLNKSGVAGVRLERQSGSCIVFRDATIQLCHVHSSPKELSEALGDVVNLVSDYLVPISNS